MALVTTAMATLGENPFIATPKAVPDAGGAFRICDDHDEDREPNSQGVYDNRM